MQARSRRRPTLQGGSNLSAFFRSILDGLYAFSGNYGVAIILFTILVRLILSPFDFKSRKSMRQMEKIGPKLNELSKKYGLYRQNYCGCKYSNRRGDE